MIRKTITYLILAILLVLLAFIFTEVKNRKENAVVGALAKTELERQEYFRQIDEQILAKSFCVVELSSGKVIYERAKDAQLPLASVTKVMSTYIIDSRSPEYELVSIDKESIMQEGDSGLYEFEKWQKGDLLDYTLITSSNDGIYALSTYLNRDSNVGEGTVELMNEKAKELGLTNTVFFNESGLDIDENLSGAYSSAHDTAKLLSYIVKNDAKVLSQTVYNNRIFVSENNLKHIAQNTNIIVNEIPSAIASKTGYTDLAGGNLAIVFDVGMLSPVAIVVLGSGLDERFDDMKKLILGTLAYYSI